MLKNKFKIIFLLFFAFAVTGCTQNKGMCTDELKICPDGEEVSRNLYNNCEFDSCPITSPLKNNEKENEALNKEEEKTTSGTDSVVIENDTIKVFGIKAGDTISSPIKIEGESSSSQESLIIELRNNDHVALVKEKVNVHPSGNDQNGTYKITINFGFQNTKEGYLAVYEENPEDGSELNLVEIPVKYNVGL